ncbi:tyrosine-type recombinase/integrase [Cryobacterium cryoconiti]|uniref:Site-specific integrase n=1 Tax=Cryobacterium cryoconiti TaxID=1259239 RepID=A0A4Y8JU76_9MICO|nr:site-specific integrase [Cryobacterium cryoconiti]TFD27471.1 site-specific integrase [Cryobacterium cryoconiti]
MASVLPKRNPSGVLVWRVQFRIDGKMSQESFQDERGARQFGGLVDRVGGKAARAVLAARASKAADTPTLSEFTARYLDEGSGMLTGIEAGTRKGYLGIAGRSFLKILGDYPIDAIEKDDVGQWIAWQEKQPSVRSKGQLIAAKTVRNYHALLSSIFAAAIQDKQRPDNPAYKTRLTAGLKREGVFLSRAEFAQVLHFVPDRYKRFVIFLAGTGCRWGEATAVTWGSLNLDSNPPTVRIVKAWKKSAGGGPILKQVKTGRSRRTISLWPEIVAALGPRGGASELMFPGPLSGGHLWYGRFRTTVWVPAVEAAQDPVRCAAAGLPVLEKRPNIHDLRHTHASWLIAAGAPLPYIQARLGHEKITTTIDLYGHLLPDAHIQLANIMADVMSGVLPSLTPPPLQLTA